MKETYEEILKANIKYINYMVHSMNVRDEAIIADLIQEGKISLWKSYKSYDETKNIGFMNYAGKRIKWDLIRYLQKNVRTIRIPKAAMEREDNEKLLNDTKTISINLPINEYGDVLGDIIPEVELDPQIDVELFKSHLIASVKKQKDLEIIKLRYGIDTYKALTYEQLAMIYDCSKQNIFIKVDRTLKNLKKNEDFRKIYS